MIAPYGYCPTCGQPGTTRARDMIGTTACGNGHEWIPTPASAPPEPTRTTLTYANQPNNDAAWALGLACQTAAKAPAGDPIDRGLVLLRELQTRGFGVVHLPAPARSSAEEGTTPRTEDVVRWQLKLPLPGEDSASPATAIRQAARVAYPIGSASWRELNRIADGLFDPAASPPEGAAGARYVQEVPGSRVPFAAGEEFSLYPSDRPESKTLDITKDGRISIAEDARPEELRAALWMVAHAFNCLRGKVADLECRPLVLLAKRDAHATALTVTGVCDRNEAERRAARFYPLPSEPRVA